MSRLSPIFGSTFLLLVTAVVAELVLSDRPVPKRIMPAVVTEAAPEAQQTKTAIATPRPDAYYAAITERPLFEITRRPIRPQEELPEPEQVAAPEPEPEEKPLFPDVILMGVLMTGDTPRALLAVAGDNANWMRQGQKLAGWTVTKIAADHVEFENDEEVVWIDLYKKRAE